MPLNLKNQKAIAFALVGISATVSVLTGSLMLSSHLPFRIDAGSLAGLAEGLQLRPNTWVAIDVLAVGCDCSRRVAEHLLARGPLAGLQEGVLLIGNDVELASRFRRSAWRLNPIGAEDASAKFGIHGVPSMVFIDPQGAVRYSGGYSRDRITGRDFEDERIWGALRTSTRLQALPVFGCAVGKELERRIDPLGLKYGLFGRLG